LVYEAAAERKKLHTVIVASGRGGQGTILMGACQKEVFWLPGSRTVIWQSYSPGGTDARGMLKLSGVTPMRLPGVAVARIGCDSKTLAWPLRKLT